MRWLAIGAAGAVLLAVAVIGSSPDPAPATATRTNVVVVIVDDMVAAWPPPGMPKLAAMAADPGQGWIRFDRAYVNSPLCCPSRATVLSGRWAHHHRVKGNGDVGEFDPTASLAFSLDETGVDTGLFGKYLNNWWSIDGPDAVPPGWDTFKALTVEAQDGYYDYTASMNGVTRSFGHAADDYSTDRFGRALRGFVRTSAEPFFAYYAPIAPHNPWTPSPERAGAFAQLPIDPLRNFNEADVSDKPAWVRAKPPLTSSEERKQLSQIRSANETLLSVDDQIAGLVDQLKADRRWNDTVVVFTSDNGHGYGAHRVKAKGCTYEECVRVPLLIHVPGETSRVDQTLVSLADLAPTVLDFQGVQVPDGVDGLSLRRLLRGGPPPAREGLLLENRASHEPPARRWWAVRTGRWLYAEYDNSDRELYDLTADPYELTSLHDDRAHASVRQRLRSLLSSLKSN